MCIRDRFGGFGNSIIWLSNHLKELAAIFAGVGAAALLAFGGTFVSTLTNAAAAVSKFFIALGPAGIAAAAITGIVAYLILFRDEIEDTQLALEKTALKPTVWQEFKISALDALTAVELGWQDLYDAADSAMRGITNASNNTNEQTNKSWLEACGVKSKGFIGFIELIATAWDAAATTLEASFTYIAAVFVDSWNGVKNWFSNLLVDLTKQWNTWTGNVINGLSSISEFFGGSRINSNPFEVYTDGVKKAYEETANFGKILLDTQERIGKPAQQAVQNLYSRVKDKELSNAKSREAASSVAGLRESNPSVQRSIEAANREAALKKAAKSNKSQKTLGQKTSEYLTTFARGIDGYLGKCAEYVNKSVRKFVPSLGRGNGIDSARLAVQTGKYHYVKYDENYTPQVGDIQSLSSWTKKGSQYGHAAMFTKNGWVSDAQQKRYGDGRIGAASQNQYDRLSRGEGNIFIARPNDSVEDLKAYNKLYGQFQKELDKTAKAYNEVTTQMQRETDNLKQLQPLKIADQQVQDALNKLADKGVMVTAEQSAEIQKLADAYEQAATAKAIYDYTKGFQDELEGIKHLTIAEQAYGDVSRYAKQANIQLTDEQIQQLAEQKAAVETQKIYESTLNEIYRDRAVELEKLAIRYQAIKDAQESGAIGNSQGNALGLNAAVDGANLIVGGTSLEGFGDLDPFAFLLASLDKFREGYTGTIADLTTQFSDFFSTMTDGFANSIGQAIVQGHGLRDSLANVAKQGLGALISGLIKFGIQWLITNTLMSTTSKAAAAASTAQATAQAASITTAYAPAATLANVATFGGASAAGISGTLAAVALASTLPALLNVGFKTGGYTGNGGINDIAGVVHGKEFVMNADATRRIGTQNLEALQNGTIGLNNSGDTNIITAGQNVINVNVENHAAGVEIEATQIDSETIRIIARREAQNVVTKQTPSIVAAEINEPNSKVSKALEANINATRRRS